MQHEITESKPLLDADGNLAEPGFAKKLLPVYRRSDIRAPKASIKEWDYYLINNGRFALALTIDDNGYMGIDSVSFLNFEEGWEKTVTPCACSLWANGVCRKPAPLAMFRPPVGVRPVF